MAVYHIKRNENEPPAAYPPEEYWRETQPWQERDLDFAEIAELNLLADDDEDSDELEAPHGWAYRLFFVILPIIMMLSFVIWTAYSLLPHYFDFGQLIRSAHLAEDESLSALQQAVVTIESNAGSGSGFNIRPDGLIVTNAHVVEGGGILSITFNQGAGGQTFSASDYQIIDGVDLALIPIKGENLPTVELSEKEISPGEPVVFIGNPLGYDWTISEGELLGRFSLNGQDTICFRGPVHPGSSGSPIFNDQAQVIAVVFAMLGDEQEEKGLAIPISYLISLMEENNNEL